MKNIILEEINRAKLLMNYNTKNTLNENLKSNDVFNFNKKVINEQGAKAILKGIFGVSDDAALQALKQTRNAKYLNAVKFLDDPIILANTGFQNVDDLVSAMAKGTLKPVQVGGVAKGLLKKGTITGNFRTTLTNKAADKGIKTLGYGGMTGKQIKKDLIQKGYNPAIADEIALRATSKTSKIPVTPKDIDDAIVNLPKVPETIKKSPWRNWKNWAIGGAISVGAAALLYSMFNDDNSPIELENTDQTPPAPAPAPAPTPNPTIIDIPGELGNEEGVKRFQDWLDGNVPNWATGYKDGKLNQGTKNPGFKSGGYGKFGPRTSAAWKNPTYKDGYLKSLQTPNESTPNNTENPYADYVVDEIETGTADNTGTPNNTDEPIEQ